MNPLYTQLMDSKGAPQVAPKANATQLGTAPMSLRSAMQKYAKGGDVKKSSGSNVSLDSYNYSVGKNAKLVNIPGVGEITTFWDEPNKRIVVSDEGYWGKNSPTGEKLQKAVDWAHDLGYQAGVVLTPYASNRFGDGVTTTAGGHSRSIPGASDQQLRDYIDAADFIVTDPYVVSQATATPDTLDNFANFTKSIGDYANEKGKDSWLVLQGFGTPDVDAQTLQDYNNRLVTENAGRYNDLSFFNLSDFGNETNAQEDPTGFYQLDTQKAVDTAAKAVEPFKMAERSNLNLPADWNAFKSNEKIDWFNSKNVSPDTLAQSGVDKADINWMAKNGYFGDVGQQQPQMMAAQSQPQTMTGIAALGGEQPYAGYQTGDSGIPGDEVNVINPIQTRPVQTDYGNNLETPMPQGSYDQLPPAQQQTDNFMSQFDNLMGNQTTTPAAAVPAAVAPLALPSDWGNFGATDKIKYFNENNVSTAQLAGQGVPQEDIEWMKQNGYQGMAQGGMAQSDIEQYLTSLGMVRK
jgi:hypothetical protein